MGTNTVFWAIMTLFFNLWAVAALYLYAFAKGTCESCGHLKKKGERYCAATAESHWKRKNRSNRNEQQRREDNMLSFL